MTGTRRAMGMAALAGLLAFAALPAHGAEAPEIVTVTERNVPRVVTAYGVVHAEADAVLSAKVLARVERIPLREGAPVKAGDLLVALDSAQIDAELAAAQAARARAAAGLKEAEAEHARIRRLFDAGSATSREMERAEAALDAARGRLAEAAAHVDEARTRKGYTRVTAPFDGRLVQRLTEVGELASPGTPLVRVEAGAGYELWADVPQGDVARLAVGSEATVFVDGLDEPIPARVVRLVPAADPRSHTFTVKVALTPGDGIAGVYAGMFGRVAIAYGSAPALTVPRTAIVRRSEVTGVYVAPEGGGGPVLRLVRPGRPVGPDQVVESGLVAGERVYVDGAAAARMRAAGDAP
jgi:RND family efflux transporter MFP subunit